MRAADRIARAVADCRPAKPAPTYRPECADDSGLLPDDLTDPCPGCGAGPGEPCQPATFACHLCGAPIVEADCGGDTVCGACSNALAPGD